MGVPQPLGVDTLVDPGLLGQPGQQLPHVGGMEGPTGQGAEQRPVGGEAEGAAHPEPLLDEGQGRGVDSGGPVVAGMARRRVAPADVDDPPADVDVVGEQGQGLVEAQAGPVEHDHQGPVPDAGGGAGRARRQQRPDVVRREQLGRQLATFVDRNQ